VLRCYFRSAAASFPPPTRSAREDVRSLWSRARTEEIRQEAKLEFLTAEHGGANQHLLIHSARLATWRNLAD